MFFLEDEPIVKELWEDAENGERFCPLCQVARLEQVSAKVFFCRDGCGKVFVKSGNIFIPPGDNEVLL